GGGGDLAEPAADGIERLTPGDADKLPHALGANALHRPLEPVGVIDPFQVAGDFLAQEAARERVVTVAPQVHRPALGDRDDHPAGVGAIVRADGANSPRDGAHGRLSRGDGWSDLSSSTGLASRTLAEIAVASGTTISETVPPAKNYRYPLARERQKWETHSHRCFRRRSVWAGRYGCGNGLKRSPGTVESSSLDSPGDGLPISYTCGKSGVPSTVRLSGAASLLGEEPAGSLVPFRPRGVGLAFPKER